MAETIKIGGELESKATGGVVARAHRIYDEDKQEYQSQINAETDAALDDRYTKDETYSKEQLNNMITTPEQQYVTVNATSETTDVTDVLPAQGSADTVYRVGFWDGTQYDTTVYTEYSWDGTQYIPLDTKEYTLATKDDFVAPDATKRAKIPTVGAVADVYGSYVENPEFIDVELDADGHILWGIKADGTIYFGAGVPPQVVDYINGKITELGLSDVNAIKAFLGDYVGSDTTLQALLAGKANKANPELSGKISLDKEIGENDEVIETSVQHVDNPEFVAVWLDKDERILFGVQADGNFLFGCGVPQQVVDHVSANYVAKEAGKNLIDSEFAESQSVIENPEYIQVETDSEDKILGGRKADGTKFENVGFEVKGTVDIDGATYTVCQSPEWIMVLVDSQERIIAGVRTDGSVYINKIEGLDAQVQEIVNILFTNKSTLDKFSESGGTLLWDNSPIEGGTISTLVVDLPVSDGTDISSGYAYIDSTDRTIKVKA